MGKKSWKTPAPVEVLWHRAGWPEIRTAYWDGETFIAACGQRFSANRALAQIRWVQRMQEVRCQCEEACETCDQACMTEQIFAEQRVK